MKNKNLRSVVLAISATAAAALLLCVHCASITGGGSEAGNARVIGQIMDRDNLPKSDIRVRIIPSSYNPITDLPLPGSQVTITDEAGFYRFTIAAGDTYNIFADNALLGENALVTGLYIRADTVRPPRGVLADPGSLKIQCSPAGDTGSGFVYLPGTPLFGRVVNGSAVIGAVPVGLLSAVNYCDTADSARDHVIAKNIPVRANVIVTMADTWFWRYSGTIVLNTTAAGAGTTGDVTDFPVVVRLTGSNFTFSQAKNDGADLRFTKSDGLTPLPCEIESWDPSGGSAAVWVRVDTIYGNSGSQHIIMHWGNAAAMSLSSGPAVFDTARGFQGVWHLSGSARVMDATGNHFDGVPSDTAPLAEPGPVGGARQFDGFSNYITMPNTASGKLNFPQNGTYSLSAWVRVDTLDNNSHMILTKGWYQYFLHIGSGLNAFEFNEYADKTGYDRTGTPAIQREWHYMTGVRSGTSQYLYVDGVCVDSTIEMFFLAAEPRTTTGDLTIGRNPAEPWFFFKGKIDEARIMNVVPGADWVRLCYANQRSDDRLVEFR